MAQTLCVWYPEWAPKERSSAELPDDRSREARLFESVVQAIEELVPRVEIAEPGLAYVPVGGALRYYGGTEPLIRKILAAIPSGVRLGLADGPFAARCAAELADESSPYVVEDTTSFLMSLDIEHLGTRELAETFRWLGVGTLGDLARLPREAVASRFGNIGLAAHRLATGEDRNPRPRPIPAGYAVESAHHSSPLEMADQVAFVSRSLAVEMLSALVEDGISPYQVLVEVESGHGGVRRRTWRSADPFNEHALAERVWWQMKAWMDDPKGIPGGVVRIRLDPSDLSDEGRQLAFFEGTDSDGEAVWQETEIGRSEVDRALTRAQALVGPDAVLQATRRGGRMPHDQVQWHPWGDRPPASESRAPWPGQTPPPSPALVSSTPPLIEVEWDGGIPTRVRLGSRWEQVLNWSGPWRLVGRWWEGEAPADRYQIVTSVGAVLCMVRDGRCYLVGVYD